MLRLLSFHATKVEIKLRFDIVSLRSRIQEEGEGELGSQDVLFCRLLHIAFLGFWLVFTASFSFVARRVYVPSIALISSREPRLNLGYGPLGSLIPGELDLKRAWEFRRTLLSSVCCTSHFWDLTLCSQPFLFVVCCVRVPLIQPSLALKAVCLRA